MAKLILTPKICRDAGWDAGNRSMRAGNRAKWNRDDLIAAADETNRLLALISEST